MYGDPNCVDKGSGRSAAGLERRISHTEATAVESEKPRLRQDFDTSLGATTRAQTQIVEQFEILNDLTTQITGAIESLDKRIHPILRQNDALVGGSKAERKEAIPPCPLASALANYNVRLRSALAYLTNLTNRVEL